MPPKESRYHAIGADTPHHGMIVDYDSQTISNHSNTFHIAQTVKARRSHDALLVQCGETGVTQSLSRAQDIQVSTFRIK